jgi:hypothetical protein
MGALTFLVIQVFFHLAVFWGLTAMTTARESDHTLVDRWHHWAVMTIILQSRHNFYR